MLDMTISDFLTYTSAKVFQGYVYIKNYIKSIDWFNLGCSIPIFGPIIAYTCLVILRTLKAFFHLVTAVWIVFWFLVTLPFRLIAYLWVLLFTSLQAFLLTILRYLIEKETKFIYWNP